MRSIPLRSPRTGCSPARPSGSSSRCPNRLIVLVQKGIRYPFEEQRKQAAVSLAHADSATGRDSEFGRTPPQDLVAEQSVLGGMMLSKDAIADCVEVLRGVDFYRPAHESIYEAIIDLYGRGEPADAVTVSDLLTKRGEISRIGGPAYLHTLIQSVPTAANAGFYAEIVRERAVLRRLVDAGTKIVQLGYSPRRRGRRDRQRGAGGDLQGRRAAHRRGLCPAEGHHRRHRRRDRIRRPPRRGYDRCPHRIL